MIIIQKYMTLIIIIIIIWDHYLTDALFSWFHFFVFKASGGVYYWSYIYYLSKFVEWIDTLFMVYQHVVVVLCVCVSMCVCVCVSVCVCARAWTCIDTLTHCHLYIYIYKRTGTQEETLEFPGTDSPTDQMSTVLRCVCVCVLRLSLSYALLPN
jgi:hypothetical protein